MANSASPAISGAFWMIGAIVAFSMMAVAGRAVSLNLDTFEIMMYRSFIGLGVVLLVSFLAGTAGDITKQDLPAHFVRNICHFTGQNLWFYALTVIPMAQVFALEFTSPLWVLLLSPLFLGEDLTRTKLFCGLLGFIGILIVTRPSPETLNSGTLAAAFAAICFAGTAIFTKRLTRNSSLTRIMFWMVAMQSVMGLICAGFDGDIALPSQENLPWLIVIAMGGLTAHFCLTTALSIAPASVVMPVDFLRLPVIAIVAWLIYSETIDVWIIIGGLIIFAANYLNILTQSRQSISTSH